MKASQADQRMKEFVHIRGIHGFVILLFVLVLSACSQATGDPSPVEVSTTEPAELPPPHVQVRVSPTLVEKTELSTATQAPPTPSTVRASLDDLGPAPELTNQVWINVDRPLRLAELRGSVVLLEMWTFG